MSEPAVVLWWGRDLRVAGGGEAAAGVLSDGQDPAEAVMALLEKSAPESSSLRLVYQPDGLEALAVPDAGGGRERCRRLLAREFPELHEPGAVWSLEPPWKAAGEGDGLLWLERGSPLPRLAAALARSGLRIHGAWPLSAVVEAALPRVCQGRGGVGLVALGERALLCCLDPAGGRRVWSRQGDGFAESILGEVAAAAARFEENEPPSGVRVIEEGPEAGRLRSGAGTPHWSEPALGEFLGRARALRRGGPEDFLAPPPLLSRWPRRRKMAAAAGAALAAGLIAGAAIAWRSRARERRERDRSQEEEARLDREFQNRRAARDEITRLDEARDRLACPPQRQGELLAALAAAVPPEIALDEVKISGSRFVIRGRVYSGDNDPVGRLREALGGADAPWRLDAAPAAVPPPAADSEFVIAGDFRPPHSPGGAEASAPLAEQVAGARARLPSAAGFDGWMRRWSGAWDVAAASGEKLPDFEIRRYRLAYRRPALEAWSDILKTVRTACAEPGVTIDDLDLAAAPDHDSFSRAAFSLTARLRPD